MADHDWEIERFRGRRRACAMPANLRRTCRKCGLIEVKSGLTLGADFQPINRPFRECGQNVPTEDTP